MDDRTALVAAILSEAHRADLASEVDRFIRECEGRIRRELRALSVRATLNDAARITPGEGLYTLPTGLQELRAAYTSDGWPLEQVGITEIRVLAGNAPVLQFAMHDENTIEFRGAPAAGAEVDIVYMGHPAPLVAGSDTNSLLQLHESLYLRGALFYLYQFTQDRELADDQDTQFQNALDMLNERVGRTIGGASVPGAYNLFGTGGPR